MVSLGQGGDGVEMTLGALELSACNSDVRTSPPQCAMRRAAPHHSTTPCHPPTHPLLLPSPPSITSSICMPFNMSAMHRPLHMFQLSSLHTAHQKKKGVKPFTSIDRGTLLKLVLPVIAPSLVFLRGGQFRWLPPLSAPRSAPPNSHPTLHTPLSSPPLLL